MSQFSYCPWHDCRWSHCLLPGLLIVHSGESTGILELSDAVSPATASTEYLGLYLLGVLGSVINWGSAKAQHTTPAALLRPRCGGLGGVDSHKDGRACQPDSFSRISTKQGRCYMHRVAD